MGKNAADLRVSDENVTRLMQTACMLQNWDEVIALSRKYRHRVTNTVVLDRLTALHYAAINNAPEAVEALLAHGADPNATSAHNVTALSFASLKGFEACVQVLLRANADATIRCLDGRAAMHLMAESRGSLALAKMLVQAGGSVLPEKIDPIEYNETQRGNGPEDENVYV